MSLANVTIQDTLYLADGSTLFNGTLLISWPGFSICGQMIGEGQMRVSVVNGILSLQLWPSDQAAITSPNTGQSLQGFLYKVTANTSQGPLIAFWQVPAVYAALTATLADIAPAWCRYSAA